MQRRTTLFTAATVIVACLLAVVVVHQTVRAQNTSAPGTHLSRSHPPAQHSVTVGIADPDLMWEPPKMEISALRHMKSIGVTSVRMDANWSFVQPQGRRNFQWTLLDRAVRLTRRVGLSVDLIIDGCPRWAAVPGTTARNQWPQPASASEFASWASDVAKRYAPMGVKIFEIWNEPNIRLFWQPAPNPAAYTADLIASYKAIKAVDPSAFVVSGGLATEPTHGVDYSPVDFLRAMYGNGAKGSFDAVGDHPYSYPVAPDTYNPSSGWSQMAETDPSLRKVMIQHGDGHKQIWITEFGAPSGGPYGIGQAGQGSELGQAIRYAKKTSWVGALYLYTWRDDGSDPKNNQDWFGLLTADNSPKLAYQDVAKAITGKH